MESPMGLADPPRTPAGRPLPQLPQPLKAAQRRSSEPGSRPCEDSSGLLRGEECGHAERGRAEGGTMYSLIEKRGQWWTEAAARRPGSAYEKFLKASRSKAVSSRRCSSVRWVFLLPVAGAAAGSRPAYLGGQSSDARPPGARTPCPCALRGRRLPHGLGTADGGAQPGLHVVVVALVLVLLLAPGQLGIGVLLHLLQQQVEGERRQLGERGLSGGRSEQRRGWRQRDSVGAGVCPHQRLHPCPHLLDPRDGHLLHHVPRFALAGEVVVHLAGAEQEPLHVFWVLGCRAIFWDHPLEVGP